MKLPRRQFLHLAAGAAALLAMSHIARAQTYPSRPITLVVPFPAGGATDPLARVLVEHMKGTLGQTIVIENVAGSRRQPGRWPGRARGARRLHTVDRSYRHARVQRRDAQFAIRRDEGL
jgi:hypothetical protein